MAGISQIRMKFFNTNIIVDSVELEKFRIFYHKRNIFIFTVIHCDLCNAVFSFYKK